MRTELLIGCGSEHTKRVWLEDAKEWQFLTTLDINPAHKPDVVHDLTTFPYPFADNLAGSIPLLIR